MEQPKTTHRSAVWSLGLSLLGLFVGIIGLRFDSYGLIFLGLLAGIIFGIVGSALGNKARRRINAHPQQYQGRSRAIAGIFIGGIEVLVFLVIAVQSFISIRGLAYNASAQSAGYNYRIGEELYFNAHSHFADNIAVMFEALSPGLADDPGVTFLFGPCNASGYTFTTRHVKGDTPYVWTNQQP